MNVVYRLIFNNRLKNNTPPFYYIGSKTNCRIENNKIIDKNNKAYYGSSNSELFLDALSEETPSVEILKEVDCYKDLLMIEREEQLKVSAKTSTEYFNLEYATVNNFTNPEYAVYKHKDLHNKRIKLRRDDPLVLDGTYIGVTSGYKTYNNGKVQIRTDENLTNDNWSLGILEDNKQYGDKNGFYGKRHNEESRKLLSERAKKQFESEEARKLLSETAKKTFTGQPKSETQLANMKSAQSKRCKDTRMLTNSITGESKRVHNSELHLYDEEIWKNPYSLKPRKNFKWITNGVISKTIDKSEELPENFWYGRTYKRK